MWIHNVTRDYAASHVVCKRHTLSNNITCIYYNAHIVMQYRTLLCNVTCSYCNVTRVYPTSHIVIATSNVYQMCHKCFKRSVTSQKSRSWSWAKCVDLIQEICMMKRGRKNSGNTKPEHGRTQIFYHWTIKSSQK